jgi:3-keto-disaccharide hydrolase
MRTLTLLLPLLVAAGLQSAAPAVEPGFTSLFNGKDFSGWKISGPAESFTIQDGAIVAKGAASHAYYDGAVKNHSFRDFELKVDVMTRAGSNGGVYVLTEFQETGGNVSASGRFPSKGFEIQVNNSHTDRVRTGSLYHVSDVLDDSPAADDQWFTEDIVVKGNTITIKVNDQQMVQWTQPADWDGGREGPGRKITGPGTIALQAHDPKSTVYYKNIRIKPLD